ncbi:MAG: hypothetical protein ACI4TF_03660 [Oliverpabstia sp.]
MKEELERYGGLDRYVELVEENKIKVEPLVIRANAGDCIEVRLTNLLPEKLEESPFQMEPLSANLFCLCMILLCYLTKREMHSIRPKYPDHMMTRVLWVSITVASRCVRG